MPILTALETDELVLSNIFDGENFDREKLLIEDKYKSLWLDAVTLPAMFVDGAIPSPGARPSVVTVTAKIDSSPVVAGTQLEPLFIYTVVSGTILYAENLQTMFDAKQVEYSPFPGMTMYAQGYFDITNNGTIWSSNFPGVNQYGTKWLALDNVWNFTNNGLVVLETVGNIEFGAQLTAFGTGNSRLRTLVNTGSFYVLNTTENSTSGSSFITSYNYNIDISNSGLIAVRAVGAAAVGISLANGGHILNSATGQILAEGNSAVAVRSGFSMGPIGIENYGLIEATALGAAPAVAVWLEAEEVYNYASGTIRSDIGVYGSGTVTNAGLIVGDIVGQEDGFLNITNLAGGQIQGDIDLGITADILNNRGTITGNVWMGAGADIVDNRNGGVISGITDLGLGNDIYHGEAGQDLVAGDSGNDSIFGYDGNDLLLGGDGDDTIEGGAGADGLYGENGNDTLITAGADVARGGNGNDLIRAGDYSFALIDGQGGRDTWVLPTGARLLDLSAVAASGRVQRIETIELTGSQGLVVQSSDVAGISGGNRLMVVQTGSDTLHLVGGWQANGSVTVDGFGYASYLLNGAEILVRGGGSVALVSVAPGGTTGLDAIAAGGPAPEPGASTGLYLTPPILYVNALEIRENTTIEATDTWFTEGTNPAVYSYIDGVTLTVNGSLFSYNDDSAGSRAVQFINMENVVVNGRVGAFSTGPLLAPLAPHFPSTLEGAAAIRDAFAVVNNGLVQSDAEYGSAFGIGTAIFTPGDPMFNIPDSLRVYDGVEDVDNFGVIDVYAANGHAFGTSGSNSFVNAASGSVLVRGYRIAIGVVARGEVTNAGAIAASILPGGTGAAYGIVMLTDGALTEHHLVNSGTVTATNAVVVMREMASGSTAPVRLYLENSGTINGQVVASEIADLVVNSGTIAGDVRLGGGNDSYDGRTGTQSATIYGEAGDDTLLTGNGAQTLDGGAGNDIMAGGAGDDIYIVDSSGDVVTEAANEGTDTVRSTALVYTLSANVENLVFIGTGNATLTGNSLANEITGGDGNDVLDGAGGADKLSGGAGDDIVRFTNVVVTSPIPEDFGQIDGGIGDDTLDLRSVYPVTVGTVSPAPNQFALGVYVGSQRYTIANIETILLGNADDFIGTGDFASGVTVRAGGGNDLFHISSSTYAYGEDGDDIFFVSPSFLSPGLQGRIDGGAGVNTLQTNILADVNLSTGIATILNSTFLVSNIQNVELAATGGHASSATGDDAANILSVNSLFDDGSVGVTLNGMGGNDELRGSMGNDMLDGGTGANLLFGRGGNDRLIVGAGADGTSIDGGAGTDTLAVTGSVSLGGLSDIEAIEFAGGSTLTLTGTQFSNGLASNTSLSGAGTMVVNMDASGNFISKLFNFVGSGVSLVINGTSGSDIFKLGNGAHTVNAGDGSDQIKGGNAADTLNGGDGADKINGAGGADILTGGAGNDVFKYANASDSALGAADRITDFVIGSDRLNFVKIDANAGLAGDQAFAFVGTGAFTGGGAGSIRYQASGGDLLVQVDVDGNGTADMEIILQGLGAQTLTGGDFVL